MPLLVSGPASGPAAGGRSLNGDPGADGCTDSEAGAVGVHPGTISDSEFSESVTRIRDLNGTAGTV
jgi:hypothetical protein